MYSKTTSTYRDMCAARIITFLFWVSVSHSAIQVLAQPSCPDLMKPLDQLDPDEFEGRWALVANSLNVILSDHPLHLSDSVTVDFFNSTFSKSNRNGEECQYLIRSISDISIKGGNYSFDVGTTITFNGTFYQTSCPDCAVISFKMNSPTYEYKALCLLSKRREVKKEEMKEFADLVKCMDMPAHVVMDPTKELCPIRSRCRA